MRPESRQLDDDPRLSETKTNFAPDSVRQLPRDIQLEIGLNQMRTAGEVNSLRSSGMLPRDVLPKICSPKEYGYTDDTYCTWAKPDETADCLKCKDLDILYLNNNELITNQTLGENAVVGIVELQHGSMRGRLVSVHKNGILNVWTPPDDRPGVWTSNIVNGDSPLGPTTSVVHLASDHIVCGFESGLICVFEYEDGWKLTPVYHEETQQTPKRGAILHLVALRSTPNASFACSDVNNNIFVYGKAETWSLYYNSSCERRVNSLIALASGRLVSACDDCAVVKVWNPPSIPEFPWDTNLLEHDSAVMSVVEISPGERIASASLDGTVRVWTRNTEETGTLWNQWKQTARLEHTGVTCIVALGAGRFASGGKGIRVWEETDPDNTWSVTDLSPSFLENKIIGDMVMVCIGPNKFAAHKLYKTDIVVCTQNQSALGWRTELIEHREWTTKIAAISSGRFAVGFYDGTIHVRTL